MESGGGGAFIQHFLDPPGLDILRALEEEIFPDESDLHLTTGMGEQKKPEALRIRRETG